ncbi:MAG: TlpA family protein disulfide reductase [Prevotella sp.]|jgi:peroxiredoxin
MRKLLFLLFFAADIVTAAAKAPLTPSDDRVYIEQTFAKAAHQRTLADNAEFMRRLGKAVDAADAYSASLIANHGTFLFLNGMLQQVEASISKMPKAVLDSEVGQKAIDAYNSVRMVDVGSKVPDFTLPTSDGKALNFYSFLKGKKCVVLDFWASWCGWCRKENPSVKAAYDAYKDKGADVLSVSLDEKEPAWRKALAQDKPTWTQAWEKRGTKAGLYKWFNLNGIPAIFLISSDGTIVAKSLRGDKISEAIQDYLNKK